MQPGQDFWADIKRSIDLYVGILLGMPDYKLKAEVTTRYRVLGVQPVARQVGTGSGLPDDPGLEEGGLGGSRFPSK